MAKCRLVPLVCLFSPWHSQPGLHSYLQSISKDLTFEEETLNIVPFHLREESYWVSCIRSSMCHSRLPNQGLQTPYWKMTLCLSTVSFLEELSWIPVLGTSWLPSSCDHMLATWAAEQQHNNRRGEIHALFWLKFLQDHSWDSIFSCLPPAAPSWKRIYLIYLAEKILRVCVANCLEIFYWVVLQSSLTQWVTDTPIFLELLVAFSEEFSWITFLTINGYFGLSLLLPAKEATFIH